MFAEELAVLDPEASLWSPVSPLLPVALRLEQNDDNYVWHGWNKSQIQTFLQQLPTHCTLLLGVWDTVENEAREPQERVVIGLICEVIHAEVHTIRTFEALAEPEFPPIEQLEPGYEHALALIRVVKAQIAPVAWALFTDKATWDEWLLSPSEQGEATNKGEKLASLARQGRCVLMGSQTRHHHF